MHRWQVVRPYPSTPVDIDNVTTSDNIATMMMGHMMMRLIKVILVIIFIITIIVMTPVHGGSRMVDNGVSYHHQQH
jgi:hypothetical protein